MKEVKERGQSVPSIYVCLYRRGGRRFIVLVVVSRFLLQGHLARPIAAQSLRFFQFLKTRTTTYLHQLSASLARDYQKYYGGLLHDEAFKSS